MWFSGLRGGVAFAIASVGYAAGSDKQSFPQVCGGLEAAQVLASRAGEGPWAHHCETSSHGVQMTDSLAILQARRRPPPSPPPPTLAAARPYPSCCCS